MIPLGHSDRKYLLFIASQSWFLSVVHHIPTQAGANTSQRKVDDTKRILSVELHQNQGRQPSSVSVMLMRQYTKAELRKHSLCSTACKLLHHLKWHYNCMLYPCHSGGSVKVKLGWEGRPLSLVFNLEYASGHPWHTIILPMFWDILQYRE